MKSVNKFIGIIKSVSIHFILLIGALTMLLPFVWMFLTSFKSPPEIIAWPPTFIPKHPTIENYITVFTVIPFLRFFLNTLFISMVGTVVTLVTSSMGGYVFAKYKFPGKEIFFLLIIGSLIVPFQAYMIPLYLITYRMHLIDTYTGILITQLVSSFGIFFMRQNISAIPDELLDSARIDGCSEFRIYYDIIFPLSKSAFCALGIFIFLSIWTFFLWPLLITNSTNKMVVELGLAVFGSRYGIRYGPMMAGAAITVIPVLMVFSILRKNIIEGSTLTGLKF
ncbi:carbohydrate ABC transporter permease [Candidatus Aerophobetes bacterium]|nr:carbohydrate ABC transporter permease [Candidatus Aerophobetes bacterium]